MADQLSREGASFSAILGHEGPKAHLKAATASGQLGHAYLLEGIRGIGKKTLTDAFVKALLCQHRSEDGESCGSCAACRSFDHHNHPDVKRIAPAEDKNSISVKQIREELIKDINICPYDSLRKVYIIEAADKLTIEAQNAMLKTLEEPPTYGIIVLLAESSTSFLPTVLSRCVRISLQPLNQALIGDWLQKRGIPKEKANMAAAFAQGAPGQALQLCENEEFEEIRRAVFDFLARIPEASQLEVMRGQQLWEKYKSAQDKLFSFMLVWYRDILVYQETGEPGRLLCSDQTRTICGLAAYYSSEKLIQIVETILDIDKKLKANANPALAIDCLLMILK
ncbi:MAG: DNA polymerase III subunit delta' [Lachnospiraceae bacterium]|jgi:DNA polymerase-3 subunit delta'|nr:DNA polymerase III subunit delta' [Lachnospiraceae bacterium]